MQVQRGYLRVRAAPCSRRGPAGAGSAASLPVARTTGCDGAISIRMIAAQGDIEAWGLQSASRFGVLGKPPKPGVYMSPPKTHLHHAERNPAGPAWTGTWPHGTGHCGGMGTEGWSRDPTGTNPRSLRKGQGTAPGLGSSCPIPMPLPLHRHRAGARVGQGDYGVLCTPQHPTTPGRAAGNARRLWSNNKGATSFLCFWYHGNLSHLA